MLLLNLLLWGVTCVLALSPLDQHTYHNIPRRSIANPAKASPIVTPSQQPNFTFAQLFNLQKKFLDNFIYPNNAEQVGRLSNPTFHHRAGVPELTTATTGQSDQFHPSRGGHLRSSRYHPHLRRSGAEYRIPLRPVRQPRCRTWPDIVARSATQLRYPPLRREPEYRLSFH